MVSTVPPVQVLQAPSAWRTVDVISDLHLQATEPATWQAWEHFMLHTTADAVVILGDLFEVWVGDDALNEPGSFEAQCAAILRRSCQRKPVYFMHGNRDFLVGTAFLQHCGLHALADPTVFCMGAQRLLLSHGDALCLDDIPYQQFRTLARSAAWQAQFLGQPLPARRAQAREIRQTSEASKKTGVTYADVDTSAACQWLQAAQATMLVHGHTHRPADHALPGGMQRHVLSDWDLAALPPRAQVLRLSATGLERVDIAPN